MWTQFTGSSREVVATYKWLLVHVSVSLPFLLSLPSSLPSSFPSLLFLLYSSLSITLVHAETQCHIHFPDSNRYNQGEKSDQVSITGLYPAVEIARKRVRVS